MVYPLLIPQKNLQFFSRISMILSIKKAYVLEYKKLSRHQNHPKDPKDQGPKTHGIPSSMTILPPILPLFSFLNPRGWSKASCHNSVKRTALFLEDCKGGGDP